MSLTGEFDDRENKCDIYRGDFMRKFRESLKEHTMKIVNFEKKLMISLTNKELQSYASQENCHICKKRFKTNTLMTRICQS